MPNAMYYRISNPLDVRDLDAQMAAWQAAGNPKANEWAIQPAAPSADAVWTAGAEWTLPPAPTFTAEGWLDAQGFGAMRLIGLLDLEAQFGGQAPPKMQAVRAWINAIRAQYAETKSEWQQAPHTFEDTMKEIKQWQTN